MTQSTRTARSNSLCSRSLPVSLSLALAAGLLAVGCSSQPKVQAPAESQTAAPAEPQTAEAPAEPNAKGGATSDRTVENVQLAPGSDPMAMILTTRQPSAEPVGSEQIRLSYPSADKAVVTVTKTGLPDDSVAATRTRYEFTPVVDNPGQWQLSKTTEQNKCQAQRGPQDWTGELCK